MGRFHLEAGSVSLRTLLEFTAAARRIGAEIEVDRWLIRPYVSGVEVTQGIQYFGAERHLTNGDDRGPDNSVRLIARKPSWVRVYVRSGLFGADQVLTGDLIVEHRTGPFLGEWTPVATLLPLAPGAVTSQRDPVYTTERGTIGSSINFAVGAALMEGMVRFTARIWSAGDATRTPIDTWQQTVDATLLQTLSLRGVFVHYNGPDPTINATNPPTVDLPAPGLANLQATAAWTLKTNPIEATGVFSSAGQMNWFAPLTGPATTSGGCSQGWIAFTYVLSLIKNNDGNRSDVIYYGLLPANMPVGPVTGCELYGVSAGRDTDQVAMAHEIGHGAELRHAPCGLPRFLLVTRGDSSLTFVANPTIDASYPAYEPYDPTNSPTASLGEYGLDITNGTIHPPTEKDYMSYCGPVWISLYHHAKLAYNDAFNPRRVGVQHWEPPDLVDPYLWPWEYIPDPPRWDGRPGDLRMKAEPVIAILGTVDDARTLEVKSVTRLQALATTRGAGPTPYVAQLLGAQGEVLATAPVVRLPAHGSGCGCGTSDPAAGPFVFEAMVPDVAPGAGLRIVKRAEEGGPGEAVWTRDAPERPPVVRSFAVTVDRGEGRATWQARGHGTLEFSLQFSKDRGRSWNGLAVGLTEMEHRFRAETLPSGRLVFRLLAHDGFHSTSRVSRPVVVSRRPPIVSILSPEAGRPFFAGAPLRLWGAVTEDDGVPADPAACQWLVDGRPVAHGIDVWVVAPEPGEHRCTLVVRGRGGTSRVEAALRTLDPRETNPRRLAGTDTATGTTARRARARRRSGAGGRRRKGGRSR
ncbi:MAG: hypothetical protein ABW216_15215 [Candidatus Rokuibacteriota bacterium]